MTKNETIERLCALTSQVGSGQKFANKFAHDCFCHKARHPEWSFEFDEKIIQFIETAVQERLNS